MLEMKAKSRLKQPLDSQPPVSEPIAPVSSSSSHSLPSQNKISETPTHSHHTRQATAKSSFNWKKYIPYIPTLLLSLPFYFGVFYLVTRVYPSEIKDSFLPNSYIIFHIILWFANYLLFSFLFLNARRGFLAAILVGILVFARIQSYILPWQVIIGLIGIFVIIELLLLGIHKLSSLLPSDSQSIVTHRPRRRVARKRS